MPKDIMCKNCNNLKYDWCDKRIDSPDPDIERDCPYFWERTNADRIRAMSDEELAKFIVEEACLYCQTYRTEECYNKCTSAQIEWLKQPAE